MSKEKNIIKTITIDVAGTEVEVTPSQARALHDALTELLGLPKSEAVVISETPTSMMVCGRGVPNA